MKLRISDISSVGFQDDASAFVLGSPALIEDSVPNVHFYSKFLAEHVAKVSRLLAPHIISSHQSLQKLARADRTPARRQTENAQMSDISSIGSEDDASPSVLGSPVSIDASEPNPHFYSQFLEEHVAKAGRLLEP